MNLGLQASTTDVTNPWIWGGFVLFVLFAMVLDLGVNRRSGGHMSAKAALSWTGLWIALALCFNGLIYHWFGPDKAGEFLAGYLLEKSLSMDNLFVFVLVFSYFRTPPKQQHRVLVWGIIGAMVLRALMIGLGAVAIRTFHFTLAFFGLFLVYTGIKLLLHDDDDDEDPSQGRLVRLIRRVIPLTDANVDGGYRSEHFFVTEDGKFRATTLFLVLLVIETSDVIFAVDSIPAIFGVTQDPFIVFTSNIFAILGLRALFFVIAIAIQRLRYLNYGLSIVLSFIGVKMLLPFIHEGALKYGEVDLHVPTWDPGLHIPTYQSLLVICGVLGFTAVLSLLRTRGETPSADAPQPDPEQPQPEPTDADPPAEASAGEPKEEEQ